jgi:hypothetical protein
LGTWVSAAAFAPKVSSIVDSKGTWTWFWHSHRVVRICRGWAVDQSTREGWPHSNQTDRSYYTIPLISPLLHFLLQVLKF